MQENVLRQDLLARVDDLEPLIRKHADDNERERHLADPIVEGLKDAKLFHMITPRPLGGLAVDLMTCYRVIEQVAAIDGSTGWCLMISGGCPPTGAFLPANVAQTIYGDPSSLATGTFFPFGRAERANGGFRVRGRWPDASESWHSKWHFGACLAYEPGSNTPQTGPDGQPLVVVPHVARDEVRRIDTWDVSGLAGSGSDDVEIDAVRSLAQTKRNPATGLPLAEQPLFQLQVAQAAAKLESARAWLYDCLQDMWDTVNEGRSIPITERAIGLLAATNATQEAATAVEIAYRAAGASANFSRSSLQRALRDVNAATQHSATAPAQMLSAGAMILGLPPQNPMMLQ